MKHIKTFESKIKKPKVGDYVICKDSFFTNEDGVVDFINNSIGQIAEENMNSYEVEYKNIPKKLESYFDFNTDYDDYNIGTFFVRKKEIVHFSPNRNDLELILNAKKYNL